MKLDEATRPKMGDRATWLSGQAVIPPLEVKPLADGQIDLFLFLPIKEKAGGNAFIRFHKKLPYDLVGVVLEEFYNDPELCVSVLFEDHPFTPDVYPKKPERGVLYQPKKIERVRL